MAKFNRAICHNCHVVFVKEQEAQQFCCDICKHNYEAEITGEKKFAISDEPKKYTDITELENRYKEKIKKANERWIKGLAKKMPKGLSFAEMSKRAEWRRVFIDKDWSRYYKGQKWDKI